MRRSVAALLLLLATTAARADLEICNNTSFVVEAAIGVESKGATATRGWFRIDPGTCRPVLRGEVSADHIFMHARALALYGVLQPLNPSHVDLCAGTEDFLIAGARKCTQPGGRLFPFAEMRPGKSGKNATLYVAESAGYEPEQARIAAIQRLLTLAGFDAEPVDGSFGAKGEAALAAFLKSKALTEQAMLRSDFFDVLLAAARDGGAPGLLWCNDTKYSVMAALAIEDNAVIATRGWWSIAPGACLRPELPRRISGRLFSFAEAVDSSGAIVEVKGRPLSWGGKEKLCVKNIRFEIRDHRNCEAQGLDVKAFVPIDLSPASGATIRFREP